MCVLPFLRSFWEHDLAIIMLKRRENIYWGEELVEEPLFNKKYVCVLLFMAIKFFYVTVVLT